MQLKDELQKIIQLQEFDSQIYNLKHKKDSDIPKQIEDLKLEFQKKKSVFTQAQDLLKQLQLKRKELELELSSKESSITKAQSQLYQLKTNKEYQTKLTEISSLKADVSLFEEKVIKILDQIDEAGKNVKVEEEKLVQEEKAFKEKSNKLNEDLKAIEDNIKTLEVKRKDIAKDIEPKILAKYEKLLQSRTGLAIVPVVDDNCGACHMSVRPQIINEIKGYADLVLCGNCLRVLYIPEDFIKE